MPLWGVSSPMREAVRLSVAISGPGVAKEPHRATTRPIVCTQGAGWVIEDGDIRVTGSRPQLSIDHAYNVASPAAEHKSRVCDPPGEGRLMSCEAENHPPSAATSAWALACMHLRCTHLSRPTKKRPPLRGAIASRRATRCYFFALASASAVCLISVSSAPARLRAAIADATGSALADTAFTMS